MLLKNKYQLFAFLSFVFLSLIIGFIYYQFWLNLTPQEQSVLTGVFKSYFGYFFIALMLLVFALGLAFDQFLNTYILPLKRTVEELRILTSVNSSHRLSIEGSNDIEALGQIINKMADRIELSENEIQETIRQAKRESEEEKNRLAAVLSGLPEGVIICNINWQIILYNHTARLLLSNHVGNGGSSVNSAEILGLGRSILGILNKNQIVHAFDEISYRLEKREEQAGYHFAHTTAGNRMLNIHAIPILTGDRAIYGFVLVLYDITEKILVADQRDLYLDSLFISIRSAMSGIRAAMETIMEFPDMQREELNKLRRIVLDESLALTRFIDRPELENLLGPKSEWPMEDFQCNELLEIIKNKAKSGLGLDVAIPIEEANLWIRIDSFSIVYAALSLLSNLNKEVTPEWVSCRFQQKDKSVIFDLLWQGNAISLQTLKEWETKLMTIGDEAMPLTLKEIVKQHNTGIWPQVTSDGFPCLRMMFPLLSPPQEAKNDLNSVISIESRREFYDFDMFNRTAALSEYGDLPLNELIYTVFDTETTGLDPRADEIISIGALRIVNGRLLRDESFDRLVNPHRSLTGESIRFHKIRPGMLDNQPDIKTTLPLFHRFVEDTVLVGHNVAFDMKMLQMKETDTGIVFANPVLDTLLLSAVIQPAQADHDIEAIAGRFGIRIIGRHTALGDAMVTAEMFLKMIPLLQAKQVFTLKQAIDASKKTYYARLKY